MSHDPVSRIALPLLFAFVSTGCGGGGDSDRRVSARDLASVAGSAVRASRASDPGDFAADLVRATNFASVVVEVDYPEGREPDAAALELMRRRIEDVCDKPGGATVLLSDPIPLAAFPSDVSGEDLETLEDAFRDRYPDELGGTAAVYVLCVPGRSERDEPEGILLGLAYRGGSLALFLDNTERMSVAGASAAAYQATALVHELGHLLGLVNAGVPMTRSHEDPDHPGHDANPTSVMHWQLRVEAFGPDVLDPGFAPFGAECLDDLRAFGGR